METLTKDIWHLVPNNDLHEHKLTTNLLLAQPTCDCDCNATIMDIDEALIIVHNPFDGREGLEWVDEILK